ncbi:MAG: hypothetical protein R3185_05645 [Candidatus Thermoplasmatota archaeon]|nr:hypothetical protein [Candidatus Thermoplasmatota archaeon]
MVLDFLRGLFGKKELDPYERKVLEKEHRELVSQISSMRATVSKLPAAKSKKKLNPQAKAMLDQVARLEKRKKEIERELGEVPEHVSRSKRRSKR